MASTPHLDLFTASPRNGSPFSMAQLRRAQAKGPLTDFLRFQALADVVYQWDDFYSKALDTTNMYTVAAGASATAFAISAAVEDGAIRGVSGATAATSGLQFSMPSTVLTGARNAGMEIRFRTSVVTETRLEMGFVDALPAVNTSLVNSLATPTFNTVAKGALYVFDNASAVDTSGLYMIGSGVSASKVAVTAPLPAADVYTTVRLQLNGQYVRMWVDGTLVAAPTAVGLTAADALKFVFSHKKSDTTTSNIDIDYLAVWKDRNN